jgi:CheY-like chemotaxis protein
MTHPCGAKARREAGILVVDDEAMIRNLLKIGLVHYGFTVWLAADGAEAMELYRRHGEAIAVVLLDVCMPELDGPQTLAALRDLNPEIRCCFMTGNPGAYGEPVLEQLAGATVLAKPFALPVVAQMLWELTGNVGVRSEHSSFLEEYLPRHNEEEKSWST